MPLEYRISRVREVYGDTQEEAVRNISRSDKARAEYYRNISGMPWGEAENYDLVIDSSRGISIMILQHIIRRTSDDHTASIFRYAFDDLLLKQKNVGNQRRNAEDDQERQDDLPDRLAGQEREQHDHGCRQ